MGEFDTTVGLLLMGLFFNTYLYGLVTMQFLAYHNTPFNDPLRVRAVVGSLFILDTLHSGVTVYAAWDLCVTNFNNPNVIFTVSWEIPFTAAATASAAVITQFFLAYRVLRLTKSKLLTGAICILSLSAFVTGVVAGVQSGIIQDVRSFGSIAPVVTLWLGLQTSADLVITLVLAVALYRSRTGIAKTDNILRRLIQGAVKTGFFTSLFALGDLFSFLLLRETNLYAMFAYPMGRIYTNTLLATLNTRVELQALNPTTVDLESDNDTIDFRTTAATGMESQQNIQLQQIHGRQEGVAMNDGTACRVDSDDKLKRDFDPDNLYASAHLGKTA